MSIFSELLSFYSKKMGINSPQIAGYCNLDRVSVYRFMKGKMLPKDKEIVSKMAEVLRLTADEKDTLTEAYEYSRLGSNIYWERRYIRAFIKAFSGAPPIIPVIQYEFDDLKDSQREALAISGRDNTIKRIQKEILKECGKAECKINLIMRAGINVVIDMLLSAGKRNSKLQVEHLIPISSAYLTRGDDSAFLQNRYSFSSDYSALDAGDGSGFYPQLLTLAETDSANSSRKDSDGSMPGSGWGGSHELLQNIFNVIRMCAEGFEYRPRYYYIRQEETGAFPAYSNLLITEESVILFTDDLGEAVLLSAPDLVNSFRGKYRRLADGKPSLFYVFRDIESLIGNANKAIIDRTRRLDEEEYYYSSLPCIIPVLTDQIISKYLRTEAVPRVRNDGNNPLDSIYTYVDAVRARYSKDDFNEISFLSEEGIRDFIKTGRIAEVPPELYSPLDEEESRQMILALSEHPHLKFRILKKELSAPEGMLSIEVMDHALFLSFYIPGKGMCYFYINEPGILLAFRDFFKNFPKEEFYPEGESREILRRIAREKS